MKFLKVVLFITLSSVSVFAFAGHSSTDAAIGGGLGGALGGFIGSETGGRTGAIVGSAAGAALGSAVTTNDSYHSKNKYYNGGHHNRVHDYYYPKHKKYNKHKKYKGCPPGLAMQGRC